MTPANAWVVQVGAASVDTWAVHGGHERRVGLRRAAAASAVLLLVPALGSCGGGSDQRTSADRVRHATPAASSDAEDVRPRAPWLLDGEGGGGGVRWQLYWAKASDGGVCQAVTFSSGTTTTTVDPEAVDALGLLDGRPDACVPQPALSSHRVDPIQLSWGSKATHGFTPAYLAGVAAPGLSDVRVVTVAGSSDVSLTPHGGFLATVSAPPQRVSFLAHGNRYSCGIDWLGGDPVDRCDGVMP